MHVWALGNADTVMRWSGNRTGSTSAASAAYIPHDLTKQAAAGSNSLKLHTTATIARLQSYAPVCKAA